MRARKGTMSWQVEKGLGIRPADSIPSLENHKRPDRNNRATIFRIPRRDRLPCSPMAVTYAAVLHKSHTVLCSKGLKPPHGKRAYKLASHRNLSERANIQLLHESMLADAQLTVHKICVRLSPDVEKRFLIDPKPSYIGDEVRRAIRQIFPNEETLFYLVMEGARGVPPHFHGAVGIPTHLLSETLLNQLTESIRNRAPFRHYRRYYNNFPVDIGATYRRNKGTGEKKPIDSGCASYALKNAIGKIHWVASAELKKKSRGFYDSMQRTAH